MRAILWLLFLAVPATAAEPVSADALALKLLDSEALYTATDGLKPVTEGFWRARFPAAQQTCDEVAEARKALAELPLGPNLEAGVYVLAAAHEGKRSASAFLAHKPSLARLIAQRKDVFGRIGVTPDTRPQAVMEAIDRAPPAGR